MQHIEKNDVGRKIPQMMALRALRIDVEDGFQIRSAMRPARTGGPSPSIWCFLWVTDKDLSQNIGTTRLEFQNLRNKAVRKYSMRCSRSLPTAKFAALNDGFGVRSRFSSNCDSPRLSLRASSPLRSGIRLLIESDDCAAEAYPVSIVTNSANCDAKGRDEF